VQLNEQLKSLDNRLEVQTGIVNEFQDIFRRKAEIELKYSQDLDKLAKTIKASKQKHDGAQLMSSKEVWNQLVTQTKKKSKDHAALAEIYSTHITQRCTNINEDLHRMYRKCRDIGYEIHEEVLKVLHELHTAMKTHHNYQSEFRQAESKLQHVEKQRLKLQNSVPVEKRERNRNYRRVEKEYLKRKQKHDDARLNATKARNEYLLCMDAANASIQKYFVDDLSDLIDCMDFGFHQSLYRAVMMHSSGLDQLRRSLQLDVEGLNKNLGSLDSRLDKQRFFEANNSSFMIPKKFEYNPVRRDETETLVHKSVLDELEVRKRKLQERLATLKVDNEEIWKSMESAEKTLSEMVSATDFDTTRFFVEEDKSAQRDPEAIVQEMKAKRQEIEDFYTKKFREYVLNSNRMARLQAKYDHIRMTLGDQSNQPNEGQSTLSRRPNVNRRRRIGKTPKLQGQPKLFGGSLEEYLEDSNQDIPTILKSCVRVVNLYGLHHQGLFRVSGSQVEIMNMREAFERGDDPLADMADASDINSVAGVLKLYFRELREPLFPIQYFDHFMELSQLESKHEFVVKVRDLVKVWPRPTFIVMRYLFAFLNHLSEFSDENMMDPWNLAICFGPTLVPIPEDRDQVQFQNQVNELIKNFIIFHEDIFPNSVSGTLYEKYLTLEPDIDMGDSPTVDQSQDNLDDDAELTEDDSVFKEDNDKDDLRDFSLDLFGKSETLEAQALYDFTARSTREVSFHKGDTVSLTRQVSNDWWKGSVRGQEGLIPDKYIMLRMKGEDDRERLESSRSNEDQRDKTDEDKRSRASSTSDKFPAASPSPIHGRRRGSVTPGSVPAASPSSQRVSRSSMTSSSRSSTSTKPSSPPHVTTVIAVESSNPGNGNPAAGGKSQATTGNGKDQPEATTTTSIEAVGAPTNTHIIKVSGPVTNLDETVTSATEAMAGPRSRLPVSPDMEAKLSTSQDSLASSTGSNRELKTQLDSTLAEVEAIAEHLEKQKKPALAKSLSDIKHPGSAQADLQAPQPMVRRNTAEQISVSKTLPGFSASGAGGARPRKFSSPPDPAPRSSMADVSTANNAPPVMLRQSSWASREHVNASGQGDAKAGGFNKNKSIWEKRTTGPGAAGSTTASMTSATDNIGSLRGGFRSNRDFWNQRTSIQQKQKQTPDLVLDLPASTAPLSKPKPRPRAKVSADSMSSSTSSSAGSSDGDETLGAADQFAKPDRNTLRKTSATGSTNSSKSDENTTTKRIPPVQARLQKKSPPEQ
jgi:SLIT-ROBO Rho GTPase activating protein